MERKNERLANEHRATADESARRLLAKYDLHPVGEPNLITDKESLPSKETDIKPDYFLAVHNVASKDIGLDMTKYRKEYLAQLTYLLEESSQDNNGKIFAHFLFDVTGEIRGAFLSIEYLMPGVESLRNKYHFFPVGLEPEALRFSDINTLTVAGPFTEQGWQSTVIIDDPQLITRICRLIEKSEPRKGSKPGPGPGEEQYGIWLDYRAGPTVCVRYYSSDGGEIVQLDTFRQWHYLPPKELKRELLKTITTGTYDNTGKTPRDVIVEFLEAQKRKDWHRVYSMFGKETGPPPYTTYLKEMQAANETLLSFDVGSMLLLRKDIAQVEVSFKSDVNGHIVVGTDEGWGCVKEAGLWNIRWLPRQ